MRLIGCSETRHPALNTLAGEWASEKIWGAQDNRFERYCSFIVEDAGDVLAAIILHNWDDKTGVIEISAAGSGRWQSRRVINEVFDTCFDRLGCSVIVMRNADDNPKAVNNSRALGFKGSLVRNLNGKGKDAWIFTLTDDDWRISRLNMKERRNEQR